MAIKKTLANYWDIGRFTVGLMIIGSLLMLGTALLSQSRIRAWGRNDSGQLGDGTRTDRLTPVQVKGPVNVTSLTNVAQIEAGGFHPVAAKMDGTAWTWGNNDAGQLGDGTMSQRTRPIQVEWFPDEHGQGDSRYQSYSGSEI